MVGQITGGGCRLETARPYAVGDMAFLTAAPPLDGFTPQRSEHNPILTPAMIARAVRLPDGGAAQVSGVFNPAATTVHGGPNDGKVAVLFRMYDSAQNRSYIGLALSADGENMDTVLDRPAVAPTLFEERLGVEDPRVTWLEDERRYAITYTGYSPQGPCVCLITTPDITDPTRYHKHGMIIEADNKNTVLFPRKVNGQYVCIMRPHPNMAIARADRLEGPWAASKSDVIVHPQADTWKSGRVGAGAPPVETPLGWLMPFHGARNVSEGNDYSMGWLLLDRENPSRVLYESPRPALTATAPYEIHRRDEGALPQLSMCNFPHGVHVVFPEGLVDRGDRYLLYYGAADKYVGVASVDKHRLWRALHSVVTTGAGTAA